MRLKEFYQPNKYSVLAFILLILLIFFIPYIPSQPTIGTTQLVPEGNYPLIFIFLMSLVVIMELFMGNFVFSDLLLFAAFILSFLLLYSISSAYGHFMLKRKKKHAQNRPTEIKPDESYVLKLDNEAPKENKDGSLKESND